MKYIIIPMIAVLIFFNGVLVGHNFTVNEPIETNPSYQADTVEITWVRDPKVLKEVFSSINVHDGEVVGLYQPVSKKKGTMYAKEPTTAEEMRTLGHECYHAFVGQWHD